MCDHMWVKSNLKYMAIVNVSSTLLDWLVGYLNLPKTLDMEISEQLLPYYELAVWFGIQGFSAGSTNCLVSLGNVEIHAESWALQIACLYGQTLEEDQSCN